MPDLKAVEITAQIEERKVLDISRLTDNDLTTIERVLEHAVIEGSPSGEDEEIAEGVYQNSWQAIEPGRDFHDNWHIDAISEHLQAVVEGDIKRLNN